MKRRFIRQNREIARVNSSQSIRIRNLETEIARLLAENVAVREEAIRANAEAERWKASCRLGKEVVRMKEQLELKLCEVNALVGELGALPEKVAARRSSQRRRHGGLVSELIKPVEDREARQRHTALLEQEGRLPAILEDKHYPRRTLEAQEIQRLVHKDYSESTESPDLGPPPVAHLDESDAFAFDPVRSPRRTSTELIEESEGTDRSQVAHVENRRKRRTSTLLQPATVNNIILEGPDETEVTVPKPEKKDSRDPPQSILKTGAKRKLEVSELEDTSKVPKGLDDFIFQRKATSGPIVTTRQSRFSRPPGKASQENAEPISEKSPERSIQSSRKILAPKSTNSPAKRKFVSNEKLDDTKHEATEKRSDRRVVSRIRTKAGSAETSDQKHAQDEEQAQLDPKTPAADPDDVLSPTSNEASTKQRPPKEMAHIHSVEDVLNSSIGRGSRRARAPVNYAQPNLRDKMRRPGKELVGAVEGLIKLQADAEKDKLNSRTSNVHVECGQQDQRSNITMHVKDDQDPAGGRVQAMWQKLESSRGEPTSPLRNKVAPTFRGDDLAAGAETEMSKGASRPSGFDMVKSSPAPDEEAGAEAPNQPGPMIRHRSAQSRPSEEHISQPGPPASYLRSRRPSSVLGTRQGERITETDEDQQKGQVHLAKFASMTNLASTGRHNNKRPGSAVKEMVSLEVEVEQSDALEPRTRSSALTRRKSMMV